MISAPVAGNLKPGARLKLGLAYLNLNNNAEALAQFKKLVADYPNTTEANEAIENVKAIYTSEGKTEELFLYEKCRQVRNANEEDDLTYKAAENRYIDKDFSSALSAFNSYLTKFRRSARTGCLVFKKRDL